MALTLRSRVELDLDRIATERGLVELAEVDRLQGIYHDFIAELAAGRGPKEQARILERLSARLLEGFGDGRASVVEGSARPLGAGEREAAIRAEIEAHEPACPVHRKGLGAVCRCRDLRGEFRRRRRRRSRRPMVRESAEAKARRYLLEGRLQVERVDEGTIRARCRGGGAVYELGFDDIGAWEPEGCWWCSCPAFGRCAHLVALQLVTVRPPPPSPPRRRRERSGVGS